MNFLYNVLDYLPSFQSPLSSLSSRGSKNILKQLIGAFLEDDLDTEQVDLQLTSGCLKLNSLNLKADAINHEMLNALVGDGTNTSNTTTTAVIPFCVERCSIDDFAVSFSSLSKILEEGCNVSASGIVIDLIPGNTLTTQLLAIAQDRAQKNRAKRLEQKAKDAKEAALQATWAARRASAIAAGLPPPTDRPLPSSKAARDSAPQSYGIDYQVDYNEDGDNGQNQEEQDNNATTYNDALAEESATFLTALLEQVFSNIRVQADNIRLRLRPTNTCKEGERDHFLEIHVPTITYKEDSNKSKILQFSSFSMSRV